MKMPRVSVAKNAVTALPAVAFLFAAALPAIGRAQAAATTPDQTTAATAVPTPAQTQTGSTAATGSEVVKMNPFEVQASDKDIGYYSQNTLAGTRMNSQLSDIGASITVVTKQQMQDTSSIDLNDMFLYEAGTEGTENYSAYGGFDKSGGVIDSIQSSPQTANRIRGLSQADVSRDYFITNSAIKTDAYNLDSVEISRGPNSTLFGIGSPSGIINQTIEKAILNKDTNEVTLRAGRWGDRRATFNFNRALIPDKLAIAVADLYQDTHSTAQKPAYDIQRRQFAAITIKPLPNTTVRANIEYYDNPNRRPNAYSPKDFVTPWLISGSPSWDPITYTATVNGVTTAPITNSTLLPGGLNSTTTSQIITYIVQGQLQLWEQAQLGTNFGNPGTPATPVSTSNVFGPIGFERLVQSTDFYSKYGASAPAGQITYPLFHTPGITNKALLNWQSLNVVSGNVGEDKAKIYNVEVEQQITDDLFLEAGWYREAFDTVQHNYVSQQNAVTIFVDPNSRLLNGVPNPYFGRPYIENFQPDDFDNPSLNEQERVALAYQLDFTKNGNWSQWLGHHNMLAFYQHRENDTSGIRYRGLIVDAHSWDSTTGIASASGAQGSLRRRFYLSNSGVASTMDPGIFTNAPITFPVTWFNTNLGTTGLWTNENATMAPVLHAASSKAQQQTWSYSYSLQDFFLKDHLVLTFGQRHDYNRNRSTLGLPTDPATGLTDPSNLNRFGAWSQASGITRQAGGVAHLTKWLSVHYNQSDNFAPTGLGEDLFGNVLPNPHGHGKDYGVALSFFDDKLVAELNWYKSDASDSRTVTTFVDRSQRIESSFFDGWALEIATNNLGPGAGQAAFNAFAANIEKQPGAFPGSNFEADTQSVAGKGWELNLIYNPLRNWNMKLTGSRDDAVQTNVEPHLLSWLAARVPVWTAATDPVLGPFWTTTNAGGINDNGQTPQQFLSATVFGSGLSSILANQGHKQQSLAKYHFSYITNYLFTSGRLKNFSIGGGLRWQSSAVIGYLGVKNPLTTPVAGAMDTLSPTAGISNKERIHMDNWISYNTKLPFLDDRIRLKVQFNIRDTLESGRLDVQGVNPDGTPNVYRIIAPRQYYLTTTFDF